MTANGLQNGLQILLARVDTEEVISRTPLQQTRDQEFSSGVGCENVPASDGIGSPPFAAFSTRDGDAESEGRSGCQANDAIDPADVSFHVSCYAGPSEHCSGHPHVYRAILYLQAPEARGQPCPLS